MDIAVIIFTYNRAEHTQQVLKALRNNDVLPQKLYVFQDGLKTEEHREAWIQVKQVIHKIDWCDCEVIEAKENKGLACAIVNGVNYVFQSNDAAIVLEDDCVPHKKFMSFMIESLCKYQMYPKVYSVSGYTNPVSVPANGTGAYFTCRAESLGWGTWRDRWCEYEQNYRLAYQLKSNPETTRQYEVWGADLEQYLHGNIDGSCNSWAVFWSLIVIEKKGYCLAPYESLVNNIGFDGTGVHSGAIPMKQILRDPADERDIVLPDKIEYPENYEQIFGNFYATVSKQKKLEMYNQLLARWLEIGDIHIGEAIKHKEHISIWGTGMICDLLISRIGSKAKIRNIIKSNVGANESYRDIPVVEMEYAKKTDLIVIIPFYDIEKIVFEHPDIAKYDYIGIDKLIG